MREMPRLSSGGTSTSSQAYCPNCGQKISLIAAGYYCMRCDMLLDRETLMQIGPPGPPSATRMREYYENALNFKKSGDIPSALDNYEKFVELSLKSLGPRRGTRIWDEVGTRWAGGWVKASDFDSMGDLYAATGNIEKARESYQMAMKRIEKLYVHPMNPLEGAQKAAAITTVRRKLEKLPQGRPAPTAAKYCMHCGASIPVDAAYCVQCGKLQ